MSACRTRAGARAPGRRRRSRRRALHRLARVRPTAVAARHRRQHGVGARARPRRPAHRRRARSHRRRPRRACGSELEAGTFPFRPELEDIHMNVERRLLELVGEAAGKLHTGPLAQRPDRARRAALPQGGRRGARARRCATCSRRWWRARPTPWTRPCPATRTCSAPSPSCSPTICWPTSSCCERDRDRFAACATRADVLPAGRRRPGRHRLPDRPRGAGRATSASPPCPPNSLDAVSDRDYVLDYLAAAAITGMHLSRLAADLTLWATAEFGFVEFSDAFATGSSIMPQKKNPDVAELIRGKSGRLYGNLMAVLTVDEGAAARLQLRHAGGQGAVLRLRRHAGGDRRRAAADAGVAHASAPTACARRPARTSRPPPTSPTTWCARACRSARATRSSARSSATRSSAGVTLEQLSLDELRRFSDRFDADVHQALTVEASLRARAVTGGTAPEAVRRALAQAASALALGRRHAVTPPRERRRRTRRVVLRSSWRRWAPAAARGRRWRPSGGSPQPVTDLRGARARGRASSWRGRCHAAASTTRASPTSAVARVFRADDAGQGDPKPALLEDDRIAGYTEVGTVRLAEPALAARAERPRRVRRPPRPRRRPPLHLRGADRRRRRAVSARRRRGSP